MGADAGERVTVQGRVHRTGGLVVLTPSLPTGIADHTGRRITVRGELAASEGSHVGVDGTLVGDTLMVSGWAPDPGPDALVRFLRTVPGVTRDQLPDSDQILPEADVIGVGGGRGRDGGWWSTIHAARLTAEIAGRVAAHPPGSVYVHGFVRDAGLPALVTPPAPVGPDPGGPSPPTPGHRPRITPP